MTHPIVLAVLYYLGGGIALYLLWGFVSLTFISTPASPTARALTSAMRVVGFLHPVGAVAAQDLVHTRATGQVAAREPGADTTTGRSWMRFDPAVGVSTAVLLGSAVAVLAAT